MCATDNMKGDANYWNGFQRFYDDLCRARDTGGVDGFKHVLKRALYSPAEERQEYSLVFHGFMDMLKLRKDFTGPLFTVVGRALDNVPIAHIMPIEERENGFTPRSPGDVVRYHVERGEPPMRAKFNLYGVVPHMVDRLPESTVRSDHFGTRILLGYDDGWTRGVTDSLEELVRTGEAVLFIHGDEELTAVDPTGVLLRDPAKKIITIDMVPLFSPARRGQKKG